MSKRALILLVAAVVSLAVGLIGQSNEIVDGLGKALCGVFLILFFIVQFFGPPETPAPGTPVPSSTSREPEHGRPHPHH